MGTRGFIGFVADEREVISYNHFDSYPGGIGVGVLKWARAAMDAADELRKRVVNLRLVDDSTPVTDEDVADLRDKFADTNVSTGDLKDWYVLLRETQGDPHAMLKAGVVLDAGEFPRDSLFCEYGYLIDLDAWTFEVYRGFQDAPHSAGRFATRGPIERTHSSAPDYYPVALWESWSMYELPTEEEFLKALGEGDGDE